MIPAVQHHPHSIVRHVEQPDRHEWREDSQDQAEGDKKSGEDQPLGKCAVRNQHPHCQEGDPGQDHPAGHEADDYPDDPVPSGLRRQGEHEDQQPGSGDHGRYRRARKGRDLRAALGQFLGRLRRRGARHDCIDNQCGQQQQKKPEQMPENTGPIPAASSRGRGLLVARLFRFVSPERSADSVGHGGSFGLVCIRYF